MAKTEETKAVAVPETKSQLPAHLQEQREVKIGNLDSSDRIIPRIKLMQGISPELSQYNEAKNGEFFHTIGEISLGKTVKVVPIRVQKSLVLWAPRNDERGILARSLDGKTWDKPNEEFEVKLKTSPKKQVWKTMNNVAESGLADFGSSIAEDKNSPPAAALTYNWIFYLPDYPELGVAAAINSRSAIKPAKLLWSKLETGTVPPYYRIYEMTAVQATNGANESFNNYQFTAAGFIEDPDVAATCKQLAIDFEKLAYRISDENEDTVDDAGRGQGPRGETSEKMASKF